MFSLCVICLYVFCHYIYVVRTSLFFQLQELRKFSMYLVYTHSKLCIYLSNLSMYFQFKLRHVFTELENFLLICTWYFFYFTPYKYTRLISICWIYVVFYQYICLNFRFGKRGYESDYFGSDAADGKQLLHWYTTIKN